jgi:hypothetical protein
MSKPITLDTWYEHLDHLQNNIQHSKWCGICNIKAKAEKQLGGVEVRKNIEFHNQAMKATAR